LFGFGRGGDVVGVDPWVDPVASSRDLFFPALIFMLFDGEDFILQEHWVFTRIRSVLLWWQVAAACMDLQTAVQR
jgi:hypothetical protein